MSAFQPIQKRVFQFSLRIIKMIVFLPKNSAGFAISQQIMRSGTSIGANIAEAQDAASKADFTHCMNIALKEARETDYWLRLITAAKLIPEAKMASLLAEIEELVKILRSSVKKLRNKN
ncbi:MAG: hypothetical protein UV61_C0024G0017 [Candidatus Gottesmanbacteria bacterium GW2011_GWB1_43_11]|uniref:Four helix bundle protein n=1 Tax=Candidatus Gottesmanbacteria bacterium GW2011_GWB1_43_11 TaxID=1618446 RepID=A0A0G1FD67_9BACT|nr:MAG: hypothetical protein UV04_C0018G0001 [Candidatus Gottesmanbacteria bacterium GW2011_GWA2_42_16]KKS54358.1 MAG: hypothetical protein UV17_C0020G0018 [Candidatus Gottesmanbacteria bacterium GW2011_GWA1_42_26]KKS84803.1 MAG: hypothetical protein UV61_C0024G0017 [Candidatus Gottesmanbacteria bacterium GW2011_GWB1_43_11]HCM37236.1 four helix bundle protein [Patescibacteria group bacterium]